MYPVDEAIAPESERSCNDEAEGAGVDDLNGVDEVDVIGQGGHEHHEDDPDEEHEAGADQPGVDEIVDEEGGAVVAHLPQPDPKDHQEQVVGHQEIGGKRGGQHDQPAL